MSPAGVRPPVGLPYRNAFSPVYADSSNETLMPLAHSAAPPAGYHVQQSHLSPSPYMQHPPYGDSAASLHERHERDEDWRRVSRERLDLREPSPTHESKSRGYQ